VAHEKLTEEEAKLLEEAIAIGSAMQHKFKPEPLYKHTGKGYMKSDGVAGAHTFGAGVSPSP
jgi:hypothetical protein